MKHDSGKGHPIRYLARACDHLCATSDKESDRDYAFKEIGLSALHRAAYTGKIKKVRRLLASGVDVNVTDNFGMTPLHDAAMKGHVNIIKLLLAAGAHVNAQDAEDCFTPLHDAILMRHTQAAKILLAAGADPKLKENGGETPLDFAKEFGLDEIVQLLINK